MLVCEKCNWENPEYASFCTNCGAQVGAALKANEERYRFNDQAATEAQSVQRDDDASVPSAEEVPVEEGGDVSEASPEAGSSDAEPIAADGLPETTKPVGVAIRGARTLVDLTVPDFRAMVDMAQPEPLLDAPSEAGGSADEAQSIPEETTEAEAEGQNPMDANGTESAPDEAAEVEPDLGDVEASANGSASLEPLEDTVDVSVDDDPSLLEAPASPSSVKDLGSLDVVIENIEGDESIDGMLLSSADVSPLELKGLTPAIKPPPAAKSLVPTGPMGLVLRCLSSTGPGAVSSLSERAIVIGRTGCELSLPNDDFVSGEHAQVTLVGGQVQVADLDSINGVWLRIRGEHRLTYGSQFLLGQQLFVVGAATDADGSNKSMTNGTRHLGVSWRASEMSISRIASSGRVVARYTLPSDGLRIGRTQGEIIISDDTYMSGVHAQVSPGESDSLQLRDLSTGNGCWVRLNGKTLLRQGDTFMTGRTCWRVGQALSS